MAILSDGSLMPFGTPGGDVQIQTMLQVVLNVLRFGMEGAGCDRGAARRQLLIPLILRTF